MPPHLADSTRSSHRTSVPATDYATSWSCRWTIPSNGLLTSHDLALLRHVNCSYLSSSKPPTLLSLKRHVQSLAILIRNLAPLTKGGTFNADNVTDPDPSNPNVLRFCDTEAFDWLNNLEEPYTTDDASHYMPLWGIHNEIRSDPTHHRCCPLADQDGRPHMTHHALTMHANECLEILDHELAATGGFLSLLPTVDDDEDRDEMAGARNTLLGQWLLHHQHLVGRVHGLERSYAAALDALAGEAVVPAQLLDKADFEAGRLQGREVGFPQDRYVLVNAGEDVTREVHGVLDDREAEMEYEEVVYRERGVSGDRMWEGEEEGAISRGLVHVDLVSRFYRIKGQGHESPIFLLPAIDSHGGAAETREMERQPTVVTVPRPGWPTRVSEWERKYRERLDKVDELERENRRLVGERDELKRRVAELELQDAVR